MASSSTPNKPNKHIAVIGAGLAGSLIAALLHKQGFEVSVFEKRGESGENDQTNNSAFGTSTSAVKRSINLALSYRGIKALEELGIEAEAMNEAIKMPKRVIHSVKGQVQLQAYGKPGQHLWSVGRQKLNNLLAEHLRSSGPLVHFYSSHTLLEVDCKSGRCKFQGHEGEVTEQVFDLVIGADGAFSAVRENMLRQGRINFQRQYVRHGYKELCIPPGPDGGFALKDFEGLHIWPRGDFMLIALPNPDKTFTATLFAPHAGKDGFDHVNPQNKADVLAYFQRHFPDVLSIMPALADDFAQNPVGSLQTIKVNPWDLGKVVLIGDAAHAVVPFYGQGMNAAFQDGLLLSRIIAEEKNNRAAGEEDYLIRSVKRFSSERQPSTDALADLCLEHYHDMASNTSSQLYLLTKKAEDILTSLFPSCFRSLYSMVAFNDIPYNQAAGIAQKQEAWVRRIVSIAALGLVGGASYAFYKQKFSR